MAKKDFVHFLRYTLITSMQAFRFRHGLIIFMFSIDCLEIILEIIISFSNFAFADR